MADVLTPKQRHKCMSHNRSEDTRPEMIVRQWLWAQGIRYRIHVRKMPGCPDIVIFPLRVAIFINGCFWHGHNVKQLPPKEGENENEAEIEDSPCCRIPKSNRLFWLRKINKNIRRDSKNNAIIRRYGWKVLTVWECMLKPKVRKETLTALSARLAEITLDMKGAKHGAEPIPYETNEDREMQIAAEGTAEYGMEENEKRAYSSYKENGEGEEFWEMM